MATSAPLLGRASELDALRSVLDLARNGLSGALVVKGEAGIGKTALLDALLAEAGGVRAARVAGIQSEADLSYAALHLLLVPFLGGLATLPPPQGAALGSAFGLQAGPAPDRLLVGLATLTLLADAAVQQPLLVVVDDAQWLDQESAGVLAFVARRLYADGIAMVFAAREPGEPAVNLDGLAQLQLGALTEEQGLELLRSAADGPVDDRVGRALVAQTRANPLALLELADELTPGQLLGQELRLDPLPLGRHLEEVYLRRVRALPPATQTFLLLASAESSGDAGLMWRAAAQLGLGPDAAEPAEAERLLLIGASVEFRHPLIRSAVYHGADRAERRRAHAALASADETDPDRRAWHRAAAAAGPDEEVAAELERSAGRARTRGGYPAAARLLKRAVELTSDEQRRPGRLLAAADAALSTGRPDQAQALLAQAVPILDTPAERAQGLRLQASIPLAHGQAGEAFRLLLRAAGAWQPLDPRRARDTLFEAFEAASWTSREATVEVARAARAAPRAPDDQATALDLLLDALTARMLDGYATAVPLMRRAVAALRAETGDLRGFSLGMTAAADMFDLGAYRALGSQMVTLARARGALNSLAIGLLMLAGAEFVIGRTRIAEALAEEGTELSRATTGIHGQVGYRIVILTSTGPEGEARAMAAAHLREAHARSQGTRGVIVPEHGLSQLELGLGNYAAAATHAARVFAMDFVGVQAAWNPANLVEAAQRAGDRDTAAAALEHLAERAPASGTPEALGLLARSRALLADDDVAEGLYREAIEHLEQSPATRDLARAHLVYGEWLRRRRRRRDARESLRTALDMFEGMSAAFFAERARSELRATGERARRRVPEARDELTPQELQIAQLAAAGASNREIGTQLFISASTVEYHLRAVFRRLGVTRRVQLRDALQDSLATARTRP
jgi:DNA-binding CsgD family transcriptional regulator